MSGSLPPNSAGARARRQGRLEARRSLAWALKVPPESLPLPQINEAATRKTPWSDLFRYPRSLLVSWLTNLGMQTTGYGVILWAPTLFVMLLGVSPAQASYLFIFVSMAGFVGRFVFPAFRS